MQKMKKIENSEPTTTVVQGSKRSLRARITAREALSSVMSVMSLRKNAYFVKCMREMGPKTVTQKR